MPKTTILKYTKYTTPREQPLRCETCLKQALLIYLFANLFASSLSAAATVTPTPASRVK